MAPENRGGGRQPDEWRSRHPPAPTRRGRYTLAMLQPGAVAPDFDVQDHLGRTVSLAGLRGKTVVLWFFPKADTPG